MILVAGGHAPSSKLRLVRIIEAWPLEINEKGTNSNHLIFDRLAGSEKPLLPAQTPLQMVPCFEKSNRIPLLTGENTNGQRYSVCGS